MFLYQQFKDHKTHWFEPNADGYSLLATSLTLAASRNTMKAHMLDMLVLGATIALCPICGITTMPLDPLFLFLLCS